MSAYTGQSISLEAGRIRKRPWRMAFFVGAIAGLKAEPRETNPYPPRRRHVIRPRVVQHGYWKRGWRFGREMRLIDKATPL